MRVTHNTKALDWSTYSWVLLGDASKTQTNVDSLTPLVNLSRYCLPTTSASQPKYINMSKLRVSHQWDGVMHLVAKNDRSAVVSPWITNEIRRVLWVTFSDLEGWILIMKTIDCQTNVIDKNKFQRSYLYWTFCRDLLPGNLLPGTPGRRL